MSCATIANRLAVRSSIDYDNQLETARAIIRSLQEELEVAKRQIELLWEKNKELEELSITDELTGLYNQRHFYSKLEQEVSRNKRQRHPLCLLFFDVDGLKAYNDTYGHLGGDDVLKAVARSLSRRIRRNVDSGYRYGGDEFAVILPEVRAEQAVEVARRISKDLRLGDGRLGGEGLPELPGCLLASAPNSELPGHGFGEAKDVKASLQYVTLSFGVAELHHGMDSKTLFRYADDAMYMAKNCKGLGPRTHTAGPDAPSLPGRIRVLPSVDKIYVYGNGIVSRSQ